MAAGIVVRDDRAAPYGQADRPGGRAPGRARHPRGQPARRTRGRGKHARGRDRARVRRQRRHHHRNRRRRASRHRPLGSGRGTRHRGLEAPSEDRDGNWWTKGRSCSSPTSLWMRPRPFFATEDPAHADIVVTNKEGQARLRRDALILRPKNLVAGIGCNSGTSADEIEDALRKTLAGHRLSFLSVRAVATIDKKGSEPGLCAFARATGLPLVTFSPDRIEPGRRGDAIACRMEGDGRAGRGRARGDPGRRGRETRRAKTADGQRDNRHRRRGAPGGAGDGRAAQGRERHALYCRHRTGERDHLTPAALSGYPGIGRDCRLRPLSGPPGRTDRGQGVRDYGDDPRDRPLPEGHRPVRPGQDGFRGQRRGPGHLRHGGAGASSS